MPPVFNVHCNGCGICANVCPSDVFSRDNDHKVPRVLYPDECWYCDACVLDCPGEGGHKGIELRVPLQLGLLWIDPAAEKRLPYDMIGDHLGNDPEYSWEMPRE